MKVKFPDRLAFAHCLADAAGAVILPYFRQRIDVVDKAASGGAAGPGGYDPVTEADRGAETAMRKLIEQSYPKDAILGEELMERSGTSGFRWVIDPLDGTRAFITGQPMWGTLIGLEKDGVQVLGVLDQPFLRERFVGAGGAAEWNRPQGTVPLRTRACPSLCEAVITTTHPGTHFTDDTRKVFARVEKVCRLSRYGGDCYAYALLAMGFVDLVMEAGLAHWDIAPLIPIVEGAGGVLTDWQGGPWRAGGNVLAAGDARTHAQALKLIAG